MKRTMKSPLLITIAIFLSFTVFPLSAEPAVPETVFSAQKDFYFRIDFGKLFDNISPGLREQFSARIPEKGKSNEPYRTKVFGNGSFFRRPGQLVRVEGRVIEPVEQHSLKANFPQFLQGITSAGGVVQTGKNADKNIHDIYFPQNNARLMISMPDAVNTNVLFLMGSSAENRVPSNDDLLKGAPAVFNTALPMAILALKPQCLRSFMQMDQTTLLLFGKTELMTLVLTVRQDKIYFTFSADNVPDTALAFLRSWAENLQACVQGIQKLNPTLLSGKLELTGVIDLRKFGSNGLVPPMPAMIPVK